jgi:DNA-binding MarR family transcriptional regulator
MTEGSGVRLAQLLIQTYEAMVEVVVGDLEHSGHRGLTAANEFAMQAVDAGANNAAALARALGVSRQAAAKAIASLETLGYVTRSSDARDGRRKDLQLTESGRTAIATGAAAFDRLHTEWVRKVGSACATEVEAALGVMKDALTTTSAR